jgi:hypothetical protein
VREAEEGERVRFPLTALASTLGREAAEFDQARLVRVQFEAELLEALLKFLEESFSLSAMLKPHDEVISVPDDYDIAPRVTLAPLLNPQVEDIMEVDIRQEG